MVQLGTNLIKLDQIGLNLIKLDQIGSNLIKLDQIVETWGWGLVPHPHPYLILLLFIFDYWKTWLKLVMLENLQACFCLFWFPSKDLESHQTVGILPPYFSSQFFKKNIELYFFFYLSDYRFSWFFVEKNFKQKMYVEIE